MKYKFNTRWKDKQLICGCLFGNPACDRYKKCEVLELTLEPFEDIKEVMSERSYKRVKGAIKERR